MSRINLKRVDRWVALLAIVFSLSVFGYHIYQRTNPYAPIIHPVPENVTRDPAIFHLNEPVITRSLFINKDSETVVADAVVQYVLVHPSNIKPDIILPTYPISGIEFEPGCEVFEFGNIVPREVQQATRELFNKGLLEVTWRLEGSNTLRTQRASSPVPFKTEQFTFVRDTAPLPEYKSETTPVCEES